MYLTFTAASVVPCGGRKNVPVYHHSAKLEAGARDMVIVTKLQHVKTLTKSRLLILFLGCVPRFQEIFL